MDEKKQTERFGVTLTGDGAIAQGEGAIAIGRGGTNIVVTGDGNIISGDVVSYNAKTALTEIEARILKTPISADEKSDLYAEITELFALISYKDEFDEVIAKRKMRNIMRISPDVFDVVVSFLSKPLRGVSAKASQVAEDVYKKSA